MAGRTGTDRAQLHELTLFLAVFLRFLQASRLELTVAGGAI